MNDLTPIEMDELMRLREAEIGPAGSRRFGRTGWLLLAALGVALAWYLLRGGPAPAAASGLPVVTVAAPLQREITCCTEPLRSCGRGCSASSRVMRWLRASDAAGDGSCAGGHAHRLTRISARPPRLRSGLGGRPEQASLMAGVIDITLIQNLVPQR